MSDVHEIAKDVLVEAFGASATPFVPVPFVDGWMFARLLRRIARKVLARHSVVSPELVRVIVTAYVKEGAAPFVQSVLVKAARFAIRKVAVVLDVKKSHDVFGESIAFALALDIGARAGWANDAYGPNLGAAMRRAMKHTSSGALEGLVRAGREAIAKERGQRGELAEAIGGEVERLRDQLEPALRHEMGV